MMNKLDSKKMATLCVFATVITMLIPLSGICADKPIVMKFAHNDSATLKTVKHAGALAMQYFIEKESAGKLKMEIFPAGQLGGEKENIEGVMAGSIQVTASSDGGLTSPYPITRTPRRFIMMALMS